LFVISLYNLSSTPIDLIHFNFINCELATSCKVSPALVCHAPIPGAFIRFRKRTKIIVAFITFVTNNNIMSSPKNWSMRIRRINCFTGIRCFHRIFFAMRQRKKEGSCISFKYWISSSTSSSWPSLPSLPSLLSITTKYPLRYFRFNYCESWACISTFVVEGLRSTRVFAATTNAMKLETLRIG